MRRRVEIQKREAEAAGGRPLSPNLHPHITPTSKRALPAL